MFKEKRLELPILSKIQVDYQFNTIILENGAGEEQRIPRSTEYRFRGDFGSLLLNQQEVETLVNFYNARQGRYEGFRIQNPCDYEATAEPKYLDDNERTYTQGIVYPFPGTNKEFQLVKAYCSIDRCSYKTITKPVEDTVFAYEDGTKLVTGYSVDLASGRLVFDSAPAGRITWAGEYDLPVRFDTEELPRVQEVYDTDNECGSFFTFDSLPVVELLDKRVPIYQKKDFQSNNNPLQLPVTPQLETSTRWKTLIENSTTGFENRLSFDDSSRLQGRFESNIYYHKETEYIVAFFVSARGRLNSFFTPFEYTPIGYNNSRIVRFNNDTLSLQLEGNDEDCGLIYTVSDISFSEFESINSSCQKQYSDQMQASVDFINPDYSADPSNFYYFQDIILTQASGTTTISITGLNADPYFNLYEETEAEALDIGWAGFDGRDASLTFESQQNKSYIIRCQNSGVEFVETDFLLSVDNGCIERRKIEDFSVFLCTSNINMLYPHPDPSVINQFWILAKDRSNYEEEKDQYDFNKGEGIGNGATIFDVAKKGETLVTTMGRSQIDGKIPIAYSPDKGISWFLSEQDDIFDYPLWGGGVASNQNVFVVAREGAIYVSSDGTNWDIKTDWLSNDYVNILRGVESGGGAFVAVNENGGIVRSEDDGETWQQSFDNPFFGEEGYNLNLRDIAYKDGVFVVTGGYGNPDTFGAGYSLDLGKTWTLIDNFPIMTDETGQVAVNNDLFVIGGADDTSKSYDENSTGAVAISSDGINWEKHLIDTPGFNNFPVGAICWSPKYQLWMAIPCISYGNEDNFSYPVALSSDAKNWKEVSVWGVPYLGYYYSRLIAFD